MGESVVGGSCKLSTALNGYSLTKDQHHPNYIKETIMTTKLNEPVRTPDGEVTTINELAEAGRITFNVSHNFYTRRGGPYTKYFADLDGTTAGWEIGKLAYLSATKQKVEV